MGIEDDKTFIDSLFETINVKMDVYKFEATKNSSGKRKVLYISPSYPIRGEQVCCSKTLGKNSGRFSIDTLKNNYSDFKLLDRNLFKGVQGGKKTVKKNKRKSKTLRRNRSYLKK